MILVLIKNSLASATTCVAGDIYKLVDGNGDHVASGKVKTSTTSESSVTLTEVSGKFSRVYKNYITTIRRRCYKYCKMEKLDTIVTTQIVQEQTEDCIYSWKWFNSGVFSI